MVKRNVKKGIFIALLCIFLVTFPGSLLLYRKGILPCTRKHFLCYSSFLSEAWDGSVERYPEKLPPSTEKIKYIYYTGWLDKKSGISFTVSDEDYCRLKEFFETSYLAEIAAYKKVNQKDVKESLAEAGLLFLDNGDMFAFDKKLTSEFLEEEGLGYLEDIFHDPADQYTILGYIGNVEGGERCNLEGVFCNERTNEIVIFAFTDIFRKSRR